MVPLLDRRTIASPQLNVGSVPVLISVDDNAILLVSRNSEQTLIIQDKLLANAAIAITMPEPNILTVLERVVFDRQAKTLIRTPSDRPGSCCRVRPA